MSAALEDLADKEDVRRTIVGVSHNIDRRRWPELRALFADSVVVDYTSLFGGEVQTQKADDLIATWQKVLTPRPATQHLLGPIDVSIRDEVADAECHVRGYHFRKGLPGGDEWMVAGHYVFQLGKERGSWKIRKMKLETSYQTGNTRILDEAAAAPVRDPAHS